MEKSNNLTYDWLQHGKTMRFYCYPKLPPDDIIDTFRDNLREIIEPKLKEALVRADELKIIRDEKLEVISKKTKEDSFERYFWSSVVFHEFSEYFVIQKWIGYWLSLWYRVSPESLPLKKTNWNSIDEQTIQRARETSIEKFFDGRLRSAGARLVGLCPFHKEKTPSFFIFPDNHFHCYGCQAHGDSIDFVMKTKDLDFIETVRYMQ